MSIIFKILFLIALIGSTVYAIDKIDDKKIKEAKVYYKKTKAYYAEYNKTFGEIVSLNKKEMEVHGNKTLKKQFSDSKKQLCDLFYENQKKYKLPNLLDPYTRTHIDILHNILKLNGEKVSLIVLEKNQFKFDNYINFLENLPQDDFQELRKEKSHNHELQVTGVAVSTKDDNLGVAHKAIAIPLLDKPFIKLQERSDNVEQDVQDLRNRYKNIITRCQKPYYQKGEENLILEGIDVTLKLKEASIEIISINNEVKTENVLENLFDDLKCKIKLAHTKNVFPHVINMSVDSEEFFQNAKQKHLVELANFFEQYDLLLVNSAGNESISLEKKHGTFFGYYPALEKRTLFVGSTDHYGDVAHFSNIPGKVLSKHFIYAPGVNIQVLSDGKQNLVDGTSFAAPIVSGTLVLLKKYFPTLDMVTLKEIVLSTASPFPHYVTNQSKEYTGCGQLDAFQAFLKARKLSNHKTSCCIM